ncbi:hypothetical protein LEP1GSC188_3322 [Leptospira weilii serovar Topaz str. LT2116]|uniref:Uncharacterized protein n=1 Tax=Leptospira weilii serovar Topaz str. LT2116 TaxID=1088540 RepID=M3GZ98_9LEPT|nr:hypothetical protein LEP1GSC188_3322 [Leptospira weilii serovar Topaz str. LT2116]
MEKLKTQSFVPVILSIYLDFKHEICSHSFEFSFTRFFDLFKSGFESF